MCGRNQIANQLKSYFRNGACTGVLLLLSETKTGASLRVNILFTTVKTLLLSRWSYLKNIDDRLFPIFCNHFGAQVHKIMREPFPLTAGQFVITLFPWYEDANRDFISIRLSKNELIDRCNW